MGTQGHLNREGLAAPGSARPVGRAGPVDAAESAAAAGRIRSAPLGRAIAADCGLYLLWSTWQLGFWMPTPVGAAWMLLVGAAFVHRHVASERDARRRAVVSRAPLGAATPWLVAAVAPLLVFRAGFNVTYEGWFPSTAAAPWGPSFESTAAGLAASTVMAVAFGPVLEEVVFRGWLQGTLVLRFGTARGILLASVLFALAHARLTWIPFYMVSGIVLGYAAHVTGTIRASVLLHAASNAAASLSRAFFGLDDISSWFAGLPLEDRSLPAAATLCLLLLVLLARGASRAARAAGDRT